MNKERKEKKSKHKYL